MDFITDIRKKSPLIFNITNEVATNFTANGLIAIGATPLMSNHPKEASEITENISALVINTGMLSEEKIESIFIAGKKANQLNVPIVLDPVAIGATTYRTKLIHRILKEIKVTAICGNAGEIAVLAGKLEKTTSPNSALDLNDLAIVKEVANRHKTITISTGAQDIISDGVQDISCSNGVPMLQNITASGCLLTSIIASFLSVSDETNNFLAATQAVVAYGIASERANYKCFGPGTFLPSFLDELYLLNYEIIQKDKRILEI